MVPLLLSTAMAMALNQSAGPGQVQNVDCRSMLENSAAGETTQMVTAADLIELVDIGYPAPIAAGLQMTLSADGKELAFPLQRASLATGAYCTGIGVLNIETRHYAVLDAHTGLAMSPGKHSGPGAPNEVPAFITPRWSPDGRWIAYQRTGSSDASIWRIDTVTGASQPTPGTDGIVADFVWSADGTHLVVSQETTYKKETADIEAEGVSGHHFDARFLPFLAAHPFAQRRTPVVQSINLATGHTREANEAEAARLNLQSVPRTSPNGSVATIDAEFTDRVGSPRMLSITDGTTARACPQDLCRNVAGAWWSGAGENLVWLRTTGWARSHQSVEVWDKGASAPRTILDTKDFLSGCVAARDSLICARESSLHPRHIVAIDLVSGKITVLYDPNAEFARKAFAPAQRLHWRTARGTEVIGDLVLPTVYQKGRRYPLIVTTYQTKGFLRGATGDEYPIQLFAARGFTVLSIQRPPDIGYNVAGVRDKISAERIGAAGWADRRNVQSAIDRGIELVEGMGLIDPGRVGLTGLSDGATTVGFGILVSDRFAAAVASQCCMDPWAMAALGPATFGTFHSFGYPGVTENKPSFWEDISPAGRAKTLRTPLLLNLGDQEFLLALQGLQAFRETDAPVDAYVFPDEGHVKLNPHHRLAIYQRNLAWFDYWLKTVPPPNPTERERWETMRVRLHTAGAQSSADKVKPSQ